MYYSSLRELGLLTTPQGKFNVDRLCTEDSRLGLEVARVPQAGSRYR